MRVLRLVFSACLLSAEEHAGELVAVVQELVERGGQVRVGHPDRALARLVLLAREQGRLNGAVP